jgi:hypothetical protein
MRIAKEAMIFSKFCMFTFADYNHWRNRISTNIVVPVSMPVPGTLTVKGTGTAGVSSSR